MPGADYLVGESVTLATIEEEDLPFLRDTIDDPAVRGGLDHVAPVNLAQEREYFEEEISDDESVSLLVCVGGEPAGTIGVGPLDDVNGTGEIGLFLAEPFWGQGYGTEAARLLTDFAFDERRLHRVWARVRDGNTGSRRIWEKLGFKREGTLREATFHEGVHVDFHVFGMLAHEWDAD